ncbi:16125_t:CDS:2 [Cetraspora pellucida]|uniref:16125_t:CDS:1 n=1 Tax=Cetraspora pellucida TaxID=1433469 RepID=A0A9N9FJ87_9GLOM|nr:16125_t:CDS:2 [Cetraspora pellucida]
MSLKAELVNIKVELDSKINELEHLKSEDISVSVVGGDSEKNISKSRPKGQYFAYKKIMNEVKKISTDIPTHTNNKIVPILESLKIDTEVTSKISDKTIINENNKDNILQPINAENQFQEIKNVTPIRSHNITIRKSEELPIIALGASMVNKYQTTPIKQIFCPTPPSCSLNSKPDYTHSMTTSENRVMNSQSTMQKNSKIPLMKLFFMDIDEATKHASSCYIGHLAINLVLNDKAEYIYKKKKSGSRYIWCDDLIVCGYHPDEPKWAFVNIYLCVAPESIQNQIIPFFTHGHHQNILLIFTTQKYHYVPMIIRENLFHILLFNSDSSPQDVSKIVDQYTDDVKSASMVINSYLYKSEFILFDLNKAEDDPLAIRLRFNTLLDL